MSIPSGPRRPPITDSPWFWVYLFATVALCGLFVYQGKYTRRQTQVEQKAQGRIRAAELKASGKTATQVSSRENLVITLKPLMVIMAVVLLIAWPVLIWQHFTAPRRRAPRSR